MLIRKATEKDTVYLIQFLNDFVKYHKDNNIISAELAPFEEYKDKDNYFKEVVAGYLNEDKFYTFVAEEDGKLVGYICGYTEERPSRIFDKKGMIEDWFVRQEYRNKGVGKQLLDALIKEFKKEKCTHLYVSAFANNHETIEKYHKMGFIDMDLSMVKEIEY